MRVENARKRMKPQEPEDAPMMAPQPGVASSSGELRPGPTAVQQPGAASSSGGPWPGPVAGDSVGVPDKRQEAEIAGRRWR